MLANLDYVDVVHIDDKHLELAVGVCEEYCITVWIPVHFPHSCSAHGDDHVDDLEECVIDNVEILLLSDDNDVNDKPLTEHLNNDNFDFCPVQNPCSFPPWVSDLQYNINYQSNIHFYCVDVLFYFYYPYKVGSCRWAIR